MAIRVGWEAASTATRVAAFALGCAAAAPFSAWSQAPDPARDAAEQRRAEERSNELRRQLEPAPAVRPESAVTASPPTALRLPLSESPCFVIRQLSLDGNDAAQFGWLLDAASGPSEDEHPLRKCLGATGIDVVAQRMQAVLQSRGYVTSRVLLQPQDLSSGNLALTVLAGRIHAVRYTDPVDPRAGSLNAMPVRPGDILNTRDIEQALENFKRVPGVQASIDIAATSHPGQSDLLISYKAGSPFRFSLSVDDSGTRATGKYQAAATLSYDNWWTLNDLFYVSASHDLAAANRDGQGTRGATIHYSLPLGYWTLGVTAGTNRYHQTVAGASQNYVYSGTSDTAEARLSRVLWRGTSGKTTASLRAFARESSNFIDDTEVQVQHRRVGGWELSVGHRQYVGNSTIDASLAYRRGTGAFGSLPSPEEAFGEGTSRFALLAADASASVPFSMGAQPLRYTAAWRAQSNRTPLTPQDRFAIGGRYTVRGFDGESSLVAERGWLVRNEVAMPLGDAAHELYAGVDVGAVGGPAAATLVGSRLAGAVLGLRGSMDAPGGSAISYDVFIGAPLHKPAGFTTSRITTGFNLNASF